MKLIRKNTQIELTRCYSVFWNQLDVCARFEPILGLIKRFDLKIVDMTYHSACQQTDHRCSMVFTLKGTIQNLEGFELTAYHNPELAQFNSDLE